ncbi:SDR family oxidoreductase [Calidifontibacillus erzurumensis]|uniref:SDR family oxidoreductase n=1 Tax=Calidifontibacillus erzurumensis TaxID=2741433 RepID=A0A8J8KCY0_9BACI|nr:SDR family oxidoreductase [Calidifontibacillus erzurumensis]NSL53062.1 SDR family oxidoreductase [Calidifontibacillus erzurumensis]
MDLGLKGKSALVLAASKGLGKAIATKLAEEGANVMLASRNEENLKSAAEEIKEKTNGNVDYVVCDITNPNSIKEMVEKTAKKFGAIDILVNNAGGPPAGVFDDFDDAAWQKAFELNLLSYVRSIREVLPYMRKQGGGKILNIASSSFKQPIDGLILSNTFRTGVLGLAKSLATELAKDKILINTLGPGRIGTDRLNELDKIEATRKGITIDEVRTAKEQTIPLGRYGLPEEFANIAVFLCSGANTYVTGQAFLVDGGMVRAF